MFRYKITIAYDGTNYGGWQVQPNAPSIQEEIEKVLLLLSKKKISVIGSGRTDAKVHALGQVAHFTLDKPIENLNRFLLSLNALLPKDIRIVNIEPTSLDFHARFSAKSKTYRYEFALLPYRDPFTLPYCYFLFQPICITTLQSALDWFSGTRDFRSFANECTRGAALSSPIKTLEPIRLIAKGGNYYCLEFTGSGFLYKMVRNITGALFDIASHKLTRPDIEAIFEKKDRRYAPRAVPGQGLFLINVDY